MSVKIQITDFLHKLGAIATNLFGESKTFLQPLEDAIEKSGSVLLKTAAYEAVIAAEQNDGTGIQKLEATVAAVVTFLTTKGVAYELNAIYGAIIAAVQQMKANNPIPADLPPLTSATINTASEEV
jgi:hypothetical protein